MLHWKCLSTFDLPKGIEPGHLKVSKHFKEQAIKEEQAKKQASEKLGFF